MPYTIVNSDTGAPFIQQSYDDEADAQIRLDALKHKIGDRYSLSIVMVDDGEGESNGPSKADREVPISGPVRRRNR